MRYCSRLTLFILVWSINPRICLTEILLEWYARTSQFHFRVIIWKPWDGMMIIIEFKPPRPPFWRVLVMYGIVVLECQPAIPLEPPSSFNVWSPKLPKTWFTVFVHLSCPVTTSSFYHTPSPCLYRLLTWDHFSICTCFLVKAMNNST